MSCHIYQICSDTTCVASSWAEPTCLEEMSGVVNVELKFHGYSYSLWGIMPELQKQKIENMSIFLASWMYLMVSIDNSSFFVIKNCTFNV